MGAIHTAEQVSDSTGTAAVCATREGGREKGRGGKDERPARNRIRAPSNWLGRQSRQELKDTCGQN